MARGRFLGRTLYLYIFMLVLNHFTFVVKVL
jgi:hypothetical protein